MLSLGPGRLTFPLTPKPHFRNFSSGFRVRKSPGHGAAAAWQGPGGSKASPDPPADDRVASSTAIFPYPNPPGYVILSKMRFFWENPLGPDERKTRSGTLGIRSRSERRACLDGAYRMTGLFSVKPDLEVSLGGISSGHGA